ncbi:MAG TPA: aspartate carbamoyltransferase [Thermotogota bacterium]|mgnify:FL=1|nr:aspartate carbamoyltransferase [Thermotogota bacterium]HRW33762.1 aspartate carbamoyltransferase [Thermotogota bacterium]
MLAGRHLIDPTDFSTQEINEMLSLSQKISENPSDYAKLCSGKILGSLFFEPSTRTRLSFEAAMLRLGGQVIGFSEAGSSSVSKGETVADTIRTVACYSDIIVMRHPKEGAPKVASMYSDVPVINAGDGGHQHPTQTLTDLLTIISVKGSLDSLKIGYCGDLKFGRTVHSLIKALSRYSDNEMHLISPKELKVPDYIKEEILDKNAIHYEEHEKLEECIDQLDILYMTRVQKERFFNEEDYIRLKDTYILNNEKMKKASPHLMILHPLPRVNEISYEIDSDPRAFYFKQAKMGMYARMGLISLLLGVC